ncbi:MULTISPECIES: hypothetical protein [Clostridia]|uniref:hypothetical protein n=1 Tax=Clostridia TaxID=186801 RepID=UPI002A88A99C|nr:hypothetical protein [Peptostreptococcus porci]MDY5098753.1 hypothetical protein [Clostridium sp.]MDY5437529.1 hypothetical protein [Peptostreptococcus porci]
MKTKTIKILSGACVAVICLAPINASQFELTEENNIKIENIKESCDFTFTHFNGTIGIK